MDAKVKQNEVIRLERESVIPIPREALLKKLNAILEENPEEQKQFNLFCTRVDYTVRAWHHMEFESLMRTYTFFNPDIVHSDQPEYGSFTPENLDHALERLLLRSLFKVKEELDERYEQLILDQFKDSSNFDADDAVQIPGMMMAGISAMGLNMLMTSLA